MDNPKREDRAILEAKIGYHFHDDNLFALSLTHSSFSNENAGERTGDAMTARGHLRCNERLEFAGDAILSALTAEYLYCHYPNALEGELTRLRSELVCERALAEYAASIDLGAYLFLGRGEEKNGARARASLLADAFEALLAALYFDAAAQGKETVCRFLYPFLEQELKKISMETLGEDYKTQLQMLVQKAGNDELSYVLIAQTGPDHDKSFTVHALLDGNVIGQGTGHSKRQAEQRAARAALALFGVR